MWQIAPESSIVFPRETSKIVDKIRVNVELKRATRRDHNIVDNLFQLYMHDFDTYLREGVGLDGRYSLDFDLKTELKRDGFWTYLAYADEQLAGFAMWSDQTVFSSPGRYVLEFFVVRGLRRQGVGKAMAHRMFDLYEGYWEVVQIAPNTEAITFWKRTIEAYIGTEYEETETHERGKHYIWQMFDNSPL